MNASSDGNALSPASPAPREGEPREGRSACEGREGLSVATAHHNQEDKQARENPQRDGQEQARRPHERAQESPDVRPHNPFSP
jgi:hypothetical protein